MAIFPRNELSRHHQLNSPCLGWGHLRLDGPVRNRRGPGFTLSRVVRVFSWPPVCLRHVRGGVGTDYVSPAVHLRLFGEANCAVLLRELESAAQILSFSKRLYFIPSFVYRSGKKCVCINCLSFLALMINRQYRLFLTLSRLQLLPCNYFLVSPRVGATVG